MARSKDVQYVRYYEYGSAARKVELPEKKKPKPEPKAVREPLPLLRLDGLSVVGIAVAAVMLLCMVIGCVQVSQANAEVEQLQAYVAGLEAENTSLQIEYEHGYDLAAVRIAAESMGMIPIEEARHITVSVPEPIEEPELSWWQELLEDFKAFFA